jgi:cellulose synthase operon protein B
MRRRIGLGMVALLAWIGGAAADERRIPLSNLMDGRERIELRGEAQTLAMTLVVPPMAPLTGAVLSLRYENAIDVLPERSHLLLALNGQPLAELPMTAFRAGPVTASITLPPDRFRIGENRLEVVQEAQNRALCSPRGTFDLWTRLHLAQSSLTLKADGEPPVPGLAQLRTLLAASDRANEPLTILRAGSAMTADHLGWGAVLAQVYGRFLGGRAPRVETAFVSTPAGLRGLGHKVALAGTRDELAPVLPSGLLERITGPFLGILPSAGGGFVLVVSGRMPEEVDAAALRLADGERPLPAEPSAVVERASPGVPPPNPRPVQREGRVTLADLGFRTATHTGYRYAGSVTVRLPADFQPVADRVVTVRVDGRFEGEYGAGTALSIRVNDRASGILDLDRRSTPKLDRAEVRLPMTAFRPGDNSIEFEAVLYPAKAGDCLRNSRKPSFTLAETTELEFPGFARVAVLPDLGIAARTGFPYARPGGPDRKGTFDLIVVGEGEAWKGAALTLMARMAQGADTLARPVPVIGWRDPGDRDALIAGPVGELPDAALRAAGVPAGWLTAALESGARMTAAVALDASLPEADRRRQIETLAGGEGNAAARWRNEPVSPVDEGAWGWAVRQTRKLAADLDDLGLRASVAPAADPMARIGTDGRLPDTALLQFEGAPGTRSTWTVLTGADSALAEKAVAALTAPARWDAVGGASLLWRSDGGTPVVLEAVETYGLISDRGDAGNLFLIAAAFLSHRIGLLFGLLLTLVVVLAVSMHLLLRLGRPKQE